MIKAYGYDRANEDAESPSELREVTLGVTIDEIDRLIAFFQDAREKFSCGQPVSGQRHVHLRDWLTSWTPSEADIVLLYED